jgi:phage FluMu protein Com
MAAKHPAPKEYDAYDVNIKKMLNVNADEKNIAMDRRGGLLLGCGALKKGKACRLPAGYGTDHPGYGRCKMHGGATTGPKSAEGKEKAKMNGVLHGLYASVLSPQEKTIFDQLANDEIASLKYEIQALKAKILNYLGKWRHDWDYYYKQKLEETQDKVRCKACGKEYFLGSLENFASRYCPTCHVMNQVELLETKSKYSTPAEAEDYADRMTKVYYNEGENGARNSYHAGTIEDRVLDRALNTLGRLIEKHARLTQEGGTDDDLVKQLNAELKNASRGKVSISWQGNAQERKKGGASNGEANTRRS